MINKMSNKFLSMEWFRSKIENSVDRVIERKIDGLINEISNEEEKSSVVKIDKCKSVKLVDNILTIVMDDGTIISKPSSTFDDFEKVKNAQTKEEILRVVSDPSIMKEKEEEKRNINKMKALQRGLEYLNELNDFTVEDNIIYLTGTSRSIPQLLVERFFEVVTAIDIEREGDEDLQDCVNKDEEFQSLKRFFMWCCLNPRAEVANSLYDFLEKNGMKITKQGFFVGLRNVVEKPEANTEIVDFITNAYNKIKGVWKKNPSRYCVLRTTDGYELRKIYEDKDFVGTNLGNLQALYLDLPNMKENRFTDNYTNTFDIRIGQVVSMPSENCDWSTQDCARAGLHFAGHTAPYVLCGDTTVFTLHNPMKVVGIGAVKGRCWEYLPFMTTSIEEANDIMTSTDFDFLQLDEQYAIKELEDLEQKVKEGFTTETSKHEFNLPNISSKEINSIVLSLSDMKNEIKNRIVTIT